MYLGSKPYSINCTVENLPYLKAWISVTVSSGDSVKPATNEQAQTQVAKTAVTMATDEVEAVVCNVDDLKSGE